MLTVSQPAIPLDYPRSILVSMGDLLDDLEFRLPRPPESFVWSGHARTRYVTELDGLREGMSYLRYLLDQTVQQLAAATSCG